MTVQELSEMTKERMIEYLETEGEIIDFRDWTEDELWDYIIDYYVPNGISLHSEVRDGDYSIMHPNETAEEFDSHEDHEPRERD